MRKTTHERLQKMESDIAELQRQSKQAAGRYHEVCRGIEAVQEISVPLIVDGEKIPKQTVGQYPQMRRQTHTRMKIATAIQLLAKMVGVELVHVKGTEGTSQAVSINEYPDDA